MRPEDPLVYPGHYPPRDRWQQFFLGVRWLGPDLSFFEGLRLQQSARTALVMEAWTDAAHREMASAVGRILHECLRWPTPYFVPSDRWLVMCGGPAFDMIDVGDLTAAISAIELHLCSKLQQDFWSSVREKAFGEIVEDPSSAKSGGLTKRFQRISTRRSKFWYPVRAARAR